MKILLLSLLISLSSCQLLLSPEAVAIEEEVAEIAIEELIEYETQKN